MKNYYNTRDTYKMYQSVSENPVDVKKYIEIVSEFLKYIVCVLFEKGTVILPEKLGVLHIIGKKLKATTEDGKIKGLAPDWDKTKKLWAIDQQAKDNKQIVYHFNEETNGIRYRIVWAKTKVLVSNKTLYDLKFTRTNKRFLSALIKTGKEYLIKD